MAILKVDYLTTNLTVMTEPLGLFLSVLSCYLILLGLERKNSGLFLFSGIVFSLCNLTRTMTLVILPGYFAIIFYILKRQHISLKKIILLLAIFIFGILITLAPWMIRQKMVYGVFDISPGSANLLYAATSPRYQRWNGAEVQEAVEKGFVSHKEQYDYFIKGAVNNIIQYPFFCLENCLTSAHEFVACYRFPLSPIPPQYEFILCFVGIILSFNLKRGYALILINNFVFLVIGSAMVANAGTPYRLFTMVSWIFDFFYIFTLAYIFCFVYFKIILKEDEPYLRRLVYDGDQISNMSFHDQGRLGRYLKWVGLSLLFFLIISSIKIIYLSFSERPLKETISTLGLRERMEILAEIDRARPGIFNPIELRNGRFIAEAVNKLVNDPEDYRNNKKIIVHLSKIDEYFYFIPKEKKIHDWFRLFTFRNYDRTIFSMGNWGWVFYIFPGKIPDGFKGKYVIAVGRLNIDMNFSHEARRIIELIAVIPYEGGYDLRDAIWATNEEHCKILDGLRN